MPGRVPIFEVASSFERTSSANAPTSRFAELPASRRRLLLAPKAYRAVPTTDAHASEHRGGPWITVMRIRNCRNGNLRWYLKALKKKWKKKRERRKKGNSFGSPRAGASGLRLIRNEPVRTIYKASQRRGREKAQGLAVYSIPFLPRGKECSAQAGIRWPENTSAAQYCSKMKAPGSVAHRGRTRRTPFPGSRGCASALAVSHKRPDARARKFTKACLGCRKSAPSASERVLRRWGRRSLAETN